MKQLSKEQTERIWHLIVEKNIKPPNLNEADMTTEKFASLTGKTTRMADKDLNRLVERGLAVKEYRWSEAKRHNVTVYILTDNALGIDTG